MNVSYCIEADTGFTFSNGSTRNCKDATNGDVLEPFATTIVTSNSVAAGISGTVEPNASSSCTINPVANFSLPACSASACFALPNNARAWWKFDELSGNTAIDSIGNNNGSLSNGPLRVNGIVGGALDFDGSNDSVVVSDNNALDFGTGDFSIEAWIRTADNNGIIVSKRQRLNSGRYLGYLFMVHNGRLLLQLADPEASFLNYLSNASVNDNNWHHVAVTVDRNSSSGGRMYVDGQLVYQFNPRSRDGNLNNSSPLTIGRVSDGQNNFFDGQIDEVTLYSRMLSANQINGIFNATSSGKCDEPSISPLQATVLCLATVPGLIGTDLQCFGSALGGTGNYQYSWDLFAESGQLFPVGNEASIIGCQGNASVSFTVNDGNTSTTDSFNLDCSGGPFGF